MLLISGIYSWAEVVCSCGNELDKCMCFMPVNVALQKGNNIKLGF